MKGRRTAAMLCVLLGHALVVLALMNLTTPETRRSAEEAPFTTQLYFFEEEEPAQSETPPDPETPDPAPTPKPQTPVSAAAEAPPPGASAAITPPGYVDWPIEGKESAARVLAAEAEAERVARMFAGPGGTWASLTKRQKSELSEFRWKPGIDGLERDEKGNTIYRVSERCVLVNFVFFGCTIGALPPAYGDLFKDMRLHFDEQRRPLSNEGNGTEPESLRPPKWQKPLP